ncbi:MULTISPECIES: EthD domain-containing protein [unclassified Novosphingobium]|uniref:EthD domain-containing protein n=1 Tax=unclassified Novosphingobium TaxID=2644732 RepID=UPI001494F7F8|nr:MULTISPECIES: EthD domain-containing protein [unclassified Novosphingobium]MBB3358275.1 hypothetical protein [Novosphingobium sp. BK256]MBB3374636.1 hypothetical protein [Novosphingobium sp. BK280]MBB3379048.1 hypothetical protein [Novosphingobium sp. BK258]MBB3420742.1 hypothetical protein [Novosphingobium sp. BK267]MBB3448136.1 hypothetical protein [Novosphingobium sp. BK352]
MLKMIIGGRRRAGMTHRDYSRYAEQVHGATVAHNPGYMTSYIQNHVLDAVYGTHAAGWVAGPDFDSFSEISFPDGAAFARSIADPYYRETIQPDELNFVCHSAIILLATRTQEVGVRVPGAAPLKLMRFIASNNASPPAAFAQAWAQEAGRIADHPALAPFLRRMTRSISIAGEADANLPANFIANAPLSPFAGVESLWFDSDDTWRAIDAYRVVIEEPQSHLSGLLDRRQEALFVVEERTIVADHKAPNAAVEMT